MLVNLSMFTLGRFELSKQITNLKYGKYNSSSFDSNYL